MYLRLRVLIIFLYFALKYWFCFFLDQNNRWLWEKHPWLCKCCLLFQIVNGLLLSDMAAARLRGHTGDGLSFSRECKMSVWELNQTSPFTIDRGWGRGTKDDSDRLYLEGIWGSAHFSFNSFMAFDLEARYHLMLHIISYSRHMQVVLFMRTCGVPTRNYFLQINFTLFWRMSFRF